MTLLAVMIVMVLLFLLWLLLLLLLYCEFSGENRGLFPKGN